MAPECPECGASVERKAGKFPANCPKCNADLSKYPDVFKDEKPYAPPPPPPGMAPKAPGA